MKLCPNCKKENQDNNKFCYYCGTDLKLLKEDIFSNKHNIKKNSSSLNQNNRKFIRNINQSVNWVINNINSNYQNIKQKNVFYSSFKKLKNFLFYKKSNNEKRVLSKTSIISFFIFLFWYSFIWFDVIPYLSESSFFTSFVATLIVSLILTLPFSVFGFFIRVILE